MATKKEVAEQIIQCLGGPDNIATFTHCATRLRFGLKDESQVDEAALKDIKEVLGTAKGGDIYQVIIGQTVALYYNEIAPLLEGHAEAMAIVDENLDAPKKRGPKEVVEAVMGFIASSISPTLPILLACGLINAFLSIATLLGLDSASGTYTTWNSLASLGFSYLPVFIAYSAAKKLRTDEYIAAFVALVCIACFNQVEELDMLGFVIPTVKYQNCIVPVLLMVPVLKVLDDLLLKYMPEQLLFVFKPLVLVIVLIPLSLYVFGPIGAAIGSALANGCLWLMDAVGPIALAVVSALHPVTVVFGMHYLFVPIMTNDIAEVGYTYLIARAFAANLAVSGATLAVGFKAKKAADREAALSAGFTGLLGITEPALFGTCLRFNSRPLIYAVCAAAVGGLWMGFAKVKAYSLTSPGILTVPVTIGTDGDLSNMINCVIGMVISFALGFALTMVFGLGEDEETAEDTDKVAGKATAQTTTKAASQATA